MGLDLTQRGSSVVQHEPHKLGDAGSNPAPALGQVAAAVRASIERGDSLGYLSHGPVGLCVDPREGVSPATLAALATGAEEAVADDTHGPDGQLGVVEADAVRFDVGRVEHERQSRLSRWQRLP